MAWITTKDGKHVNTDWFDKDRQINANKAEANRLNSRTEVVNSPINVVSESKKEEYKQTLKNVKSEYKKFMLQNQEKLQSGLDLDSPTVQQYLALSKKLDEATYNAHSVMPPVMNDPNKWNKNISALSRENAIIVRKDLLQNKKLYMAISSASHGTSYGSTTTDTAVDALYQQDNTVYNVFTNTRRMLKDTYGEEMTLYRVGTRATKKTTINMTSTKQNAQQYADWYGGKVSAINVKVDDILAINIDRQGNYEEFIILNRKR